MDRKLTFRKLMQTVREALRGDHADYTTGPLTDAIILLAVPMVVEMLIGRCLPSSTSSGCRGWGETPSPRSA